MRADFSVPPGGDRQQSIDRTSGPEGFDRIAFTAPYVLIDSDNAGLATARSLGEAHAYVASRPEARTIAGTLRDQLLAVDIDPQDCGAEAEAGEALTDLLVAWCERHGLWWTKRASGRPGHYHLVVHVPQQLRPEFRTVVRDLSAHQRVPATIRSTIRLLTAPHRTGVTGGVASENLTAASLEDLRLALGVKRASRGKTRQVVLRPSGSANLVATSRRSRSESEFGETLARVRALWPIQRAWAAAQRPGSKAAEIGYSAWRRWFWAPAVSVVDAERGTDVEFAWENFRRASPEQARHLGYAGWLTSRWRPAVTEAATSRPRRLRTAPGSAADVPAEEEASATRVVREQVAAMSDRLAESACRAAARVGRLPGGVRLRTLCIALRVLGHAIVTRDGSISVRAWAEKAHLDPKTIRRARDAAEHLGLIERIRRYGGSADDCDAWMPPSNLDEPAAPGAQDRDSPTGRYAPYRDSRGSASIERLRDTHRADRARWKAYLSSRWLQCPGMVVAASRKAFAITLQRRWWTSLTAAEQSIRKAARRALITALPPAGKMRWISWLVHRRRLASAATRVAAGVARAGDLRSVGSAPAAMFLGLRTLDTISGHGRLESRDS